MIIHVPQIDLFDPKNVGATWRNLGVDCANRFWRNSGATWRSYSKKCLCLLSFFMHKLAQLWRSPASLRQLLPLRGSWRSPMIDCEVYRFNRCEKIQRDGARSPASNLWRVLVREDVTRAATEPILHLPRVESILNFSVRFFLDSLIVGCSP